MKKKLSMIMLMFLVIISVSLLSKTNTFAASNSPLENMVPGDRIKFAGKEWIILDPNMGYIILDSNDGYKEWNENPSSNNYETSTIRQYLNNDFLNSLGAENEDLIMKVIWNCGVQEKINDSVVGSGVVSGSISMDFSGESSKKVRDKIGLLTYSEYKSYSKYYNPSGGVLDENDWNYNWWLLTGNSTDFMLNMFAVNSGGNIYGCNSGGLDQTGVCNLTVGIRPTLYLKSGLYVNTNNEIVTYAKTIDLDVTTEDNKTTSDEDGYNTITISGIVKDGLGSEIYYRVDGNNGYVGTKLGVNITTDYESFSKEVNLGAVSEGNHKLYIWAEGSDGSKSSEVSRSFKVDKSIITVNSPTVIAISDTEIKIIPNPLAGIALDPTPYLYNRDGSDIGIWMAGNPYIDTSLTPNTKYIYKYKAKNSFNESEYSEEVSGYTKALNPKSISKGSVNHNSIGFTITNDSKNGEAPEHRLELKLKDAGLAGENKGVSNWSKSTSPRIYGLNQNTEYELWIETRNGDRIENTKYKVNEIFKTGIYSSSYVPSTNPSIKEKDIQEANNIEGLKEIHENIKDLVGQQKQTLLQELTERYFKMMNDLSELEFIQSVIDDMEEGEEKRELQIRLEGKKMIYSEDFKPWNEYKETPQLKDKVWQVKFNSGLDKKTMKIEDDNITVVDEDGYRIEIRLEYDEATKTLRIIPLSNFNSGKKYYLILGKEVKNKDGDLLEKPIRMEFKIK